MVSYVAIQIGHLAIQWPLWVSETTLRPKYRVFQVLEIDTPHDILLFILIYAVCKVAVKVATW